MRWQLTIVVGLLLAACDQKSGADSGGDAVNDATDASTDAGFVALDAADAATAGDAAADEVPVPCTVDEAAKCDDHNACTVDTCAAGSCSHSAATNSCDDGDPCTVEDVCAAGNCKGKPKDCDDKSPCTIDNCQLDGSCTHVHNQHEDCLPLIQVDQPPRALRQKSNDATLTVSGKLVAQNSQPKSLTVQGKDVAFAGDGTFATTIPLEYGAQTLVLEVTDVYGGKRQQVQGIHWATSWLPGAAAVPAGALRVVTQADAAAWVSGLQAQLDAAQFQVPIAFAAANVAVNLMWLAAPLASTADTQQLALSVQPTPVAVAAEMAATLTTDPGTPAHDACTPALANLGLDPTGTAVQWTVSQDALNAALRAAWLGGQLTGDVSPIGEGLAPGVKVAGQIHADLPWLLQDCPGSTATLRLGDLRLEIQAYIGDTTELLATATAHVAIEVAPIYALNNGKVELRLGQTQSIQLDLATGSKDMQATDVHVAMGKALHDNSIPALLKEWAKAPLVSIPLAMDAKVAGQPLTWQFQAALDLLAGVLRANGAFVAP